MLDTLATPDKGNFRIDRQIKWMLDTPFYKGENRIDRKNKWMLDTPVTRQRKY